MKIYTRITAFVFILMNCLLIYYGKNLFDKIGLPAILSVLFILFFGVLIPGLFEFIDEFWELIGNDIKTIYKEIIKFLKFYTNV